MVENLNSTHFKNGDSIPEVKTDEDWINNQQTTSLVLLQK